MYGASDGVRYLVVPFGLAQATFFEANVVPSPLGHSRQSRTCTDLHFLLSYLGAQDGIVVVYRTRG